ncbi:MAG: hypothetical protein ACKO0Z_06880 [Betaproteobacteria bacterium]
MADNDNAGCNNLDRRLFNYAAELLAASVHDYEKASTSKSAARRMVNIYDTLLQIYRNEGLPGNLFAHDYGEAVPARIVERIEEAREALKRKHGI